MALAELDLSDTGEECMDNCLEAMQAEECRRHDHDHCQVCADVLDDCTESCRQMLQQV